MEQHRKHRGNGKRSCRRNQGKGGEAVLHTCEDFDGSKVAEYDAIAFGCPAMGDEVLEDTEFEPMFDGCKDALKGKNIALFGSYGWGDGEWMRNWKSPVKKQVQILYATA